jgi:hypothetical protein
MHTGNCRKKAHSNDAKIRARLKRKRVQPEIASGERVETRRVKVPRRPRQPIFVEDVGMMRVRKCKWLRNVNRHVRMVRTVNVRI